MTREGSWPPAAQPLLPGRHTKGTQRGDPSVGGTVLEGPQGLVPQTVTPEPDSTLLEEAGVAGVCLVLHRPGQGASAACSTLSLSECLQPVLGSWGALAWALAPPRLSPALPPACLSPSCVTCHLSPRCSVPALANPPSADCGPHWLSPPMRHSPPAPAPGFWNLPLPPPLPAGNVSTTSLDTRTVKGGQQLALDTPWLTMGQRCVRTEVANRAGAGRQAPRAGGQPSPAACGHRAQAPVRGGQSWGC